MRRPLGRMRTLAVALGLPVLSLGVLSLSVPAATVSPSSESLAMHLVSTEFEAGGEIPALHTCQGQDLSPALAWRDLPAGTRSLVLIVDDPDAPDPAAPKLTWVHWVLYDLPPTATGLPQGAGAKDSTLLPPGTRQGTNSWGRTGYGGPCPPIGRHRYFHKLYALDAVLGDLSKPDVDALMTALTPHILGQVQLIGTYQKQ